MAATSVEDMRWAHWQQLYQRASPFANETGPLPCGEFEPSPTIFQTLQNTPVLVVGAGGLGCEILKNLALSGLKNIHVIDLDTIDISNLNRQFLFRMSDVGKGKAEVAANFIMRRVAGCKVTPYMGKIQDVDKIPGVNKTAEDFYRQFKVIISGLDNVEARRWLNSMIVNLLEYDDNGDLNPASIIPFIDGGTEGFRGQSRVMLPKLTACFECNLDLFPPQKTFQLCTIAETPRIPEHCIAYVYMLEWDKFFPDKKLDKDSPEDMTWIYERALDRAKMYGIEGVTYFKTMGVVKNIIPAIASTNAIISAVCANEAVKILTYCSQSLNNYFMYMGNEGLYTNNFEQEPRKDCCVCSDEAITKPITIDPNMTLKEFMQQLVEEPSLQLKSPNSITKGSDITLYMKTQEEKTHGNLSKLMSELTAEGDVLYVTDPVLYCVAVSVELRFLK